MHNLEQHWVLGFYWVSCNFQEVNPNSANEAQNCWGFKTYN